MLDSADPGALHNATARARGVRTGDSQHGFFTSPLTRQPESTALIANTGAPDGRNVAVRSGHGSEPTRLWFTDVSSAMLQSTVVTWAPNRDGSTN